MTKIISIVNLKGGVGKTTTAYYLSRLLQSKKLLIDATSETNLTNLMIHGEVIDRNIINFLSDQIEFAKLPYPIHDIDFIPGTQEMGNLEKALASSKKPELVLKSKLKDYIKNYDYVIIDCPPHLSIILRAALIIANVVIIPVNMDEQAIRDGMGIIINIKVMEKSKKYGKDIHIDKIYILPTMKRRFDRLDNEIYKEILLQFRDYDILPLIRYDTNIRLTMNQKKIIPGKGYKEYQKIAEIIK